jgi:hypothetical protein
VQNLLSLGLWDTLRSIFIALLVVIGVFDLVRTSIINCWSTCQHASRNEAGLQRLSVAAIIFDIVN